MNNITYDSRIWVSFTSDYAFEMPTIYFKRNGGEYSGARLYLERDIGDWSKEQIAFLKKTYGQALKHPKYDEVWYYKPREQTNAERNVMENVTYRCILEVFSPKKPPKERYGGQYFQLPTPTVKTPCFLLSLFAPKFDAIEDCLGLLPASVRIEPSCWRTLNFGETHSCAPLRVDTPSNFRPRILDMSKNPNASKTIDSFFADDPNGIVLADELKAAIGDLARRFDEASETQYKQFRKMSTDNHIKMSTDSHIWRYNFPNDLYSCLNFDFGTTLTRKLQQKNIDGTRFVVPMRMSLCSANHNTVFNQSWEFNLEILPQKSLSGSVVVLDCGTSSCYACFTHPALAGQNTLATSDEQAECRRVNLSQWLTDPNAQYRDILNLLLLETLDALEPSSSDRGNLESVDDRLTDPVKQYLNVAGIFKFMATFEHKLRRRLGELLNRTRDQLNGNDYERRNAYISFAEKLYEIDKKTFETYPEKLKKIKSAQLDGNSQTIVSEFLFKEDKFGVPDGILGKVELENRLSSAVDAYLKKYKSFTGEDVCLPSNDVRFFQNPKANIFHIHRHDSEAGRVYQGFVNSVLQRVLNEYHRIYWNGDEVPYLALTYPATLSPMGRRRLRELAMQLGFPKVDLSCDESVAPAIFYLDKFCGAADELGLENFKTRCTRINNLWYHNMLIIDVGAGTTDVSLVQFEIEERYARNPKIAGGREYYVTPYLLASQGNQNFAGNYLTLTIFHYLRALLVLSKNDNDLELRYLKRQPDFFSSLNDKTLEAVKTNASSKLPTDYMPDVERNEVGISREEFEARFRRFNALWDVAEQIKIRMSDEQKENNGKVRDLDIKPFLEKYRNEIGWDLPENELLFDGVVFEALQNSLVDKIVGKLVVDLTKEALGIRKGNRPDLQRACRGIDTIILSGCSSRLPNLKKKLKETIDSSASNAQGAPQPFATTRTRVFFEEKYAKSATALGAASAWNIAHSGCVDINDNHNVDYGFCTSQIDVKNMSFYLSSSFVENRGNKEKNLTYFKLQSKYVRCGLGRKELYSILTKKWYGYFHFFQIGKQIGNLPPNPPVYAEFHFDTFCSSIRGVNKGKIRVFDEQNGLVDRVLEEQALKVRFEIDLEQDVYALVGRVNDALDQNAVKDCKTPDFSYTVKIRGIEDEAYERYGCQIDLPKEWLVIEEGVARLAEGITFGDGIQLFDKGQTLEHKCLDLDGAKLLCCWSERSFKPFVTRTHTTQLLSTLYNNGDAVFNLDSYYQTMRRYGVSEDELYEIELKVMLTVKLNEKGVPVPETLRAHIFVGAEPAYAETEDVKEWTNTPDLIYRTRITKYDPYFTDKYNPFSGKH